MKRIGVSLVALTAGFGPAFAQDAARAQEEEGLFRLSPVLVTTQKRAESVIDVPISVTAYDEARLDQLGIEQFDELSAFVPGLNVQEQSPNNPGFVIRGITSDSGEANIEPRVALFQDGISLSRSRGSFVELFDLERVEVVKGPQPTLFGRSALIGAVSIIQKKADPTGRDGYFEIGGGNDGFFNVQGAANLPLIQDVLAVRVAGTHKERDGAVENPLEGQGDLNGVGIDAFRISAAFTPTSALRVDAIYNRQEDDYPGTAFVSGSFPVPGADTVNVFEQGALNTFGGFQNGDPLGLDRTVESATLLVEYQVNDALTVNSISGWRAFDSREVFDPDGAAFPLFIFAENAEGEQYSTELRLDYDAGGRFKGFVGASYFTEDGEQQVPLGFGESTVQAFTAPLLAGGLAQAGALEGVPGASPVEQLNTLLAGLTGGPVSVTDLNDPFPFAISASLGSLAAGGGLVATKPIHIEQFTNFGETDSVDVFADASYALTDALEVTAGVRYTHDDKTAGIVGEVLNGPTTVPLSPGAPGLFTAVTPGGEPVFESDEFDGLTWRFAANYALNDALNLFATYSRGRRPDVISVTTPADFGQVPAETVDSLEGGVKGLVLDGGLQFDASIFYYDYTNFQTTEIQGTEIVTINAGDASSLGFEGQADWQVNERLSLGGTYGFNDAEFDSGAREGNRPRLSPEHTLSVYGQYLQSVPALGGEVFLRPSFTWQSEVFFDDDNDRADIQNIGRLPTFLDTAVDEVQEAYGVLNLRGGLRWERFTLEGFATNLLDEEFLIDAGNTGDGFGIPTFIRGEPRYYGITLRAEL